MVKLRAYSVFKDEGIILPTDLTKNNWYTIPEGFNEALWSSCFSQDVNIKVALSSLQFNIIELR